MDKNEVLVDRHHYLVVPSDPAQRAITDKVEIMSRTKLISDYKIRLNAGYMTTIACVYVESLITILVKLMRESHGDSKINFMDMFTVESVNRENDDADKDGNINIKFIPGTVIQSIMERDFSPIITEDMWEDTIITLVEAECRKTLQAKHKMNSPTATIYTKIAFVYFEYLFRILKMLGKAAHENGNTAASINFLELFEAHVTVDVITNPENPDLVSETYTCKLRPGFQAKLLIKDDGVTEIDDEDED